MIYAFVVLAIVVVLFTGVLCYAVGIRKASAVVPIQFVVSYASLLGMAHYLARDSYSNTSIAVTAGVICLVFFGLEIFLRNTIGPLHNRRTGREEREFQRSQKEIERRVGRGHHGQPSPTA